jgi:hypothetical protein
MLKEDGGTHVGYVTAGFVDRLIFRVAEVQLQSQSSAQIANVVGTDRFQKCPRDTMPTYGRVFGVRVRRVYEIDNFEKENRRRFDDMRRILVERERFFPFRYYTSKRKKEKKVIGGQCKTRSEGTTHLCSLKLNGLVMTGSIQLDVSWL